VADKKTQIELSASADGVVSGVEKAKKSLGELGATATNVGKQGSEGLGKLGGGADAAARKIEATTKNLIALAQRNIAAIEAGVDASGRMSSKFIESLARQRGATIGVLKPYLDQLDEVAAKQRLVNQQSQRLTAPVGLTTSLGATNFSRPLPSNLTTSLGATAFGEVAAGATKAKGAVDGLNKSFDYGTLSAKQTTAALRQVPAQLTDIFVSLQGGQAPLTVLLQQGGQLKDVFGGIGPAARALGGYVVSLINPFTLAAAAAGALALAYNQGSKEADAYAKAIILSGNAAGTTVGQLTQMAVAIDGVVGTQSNAAEALAAFAADGNVAADSLQRITTIAIQFERTAGQAIDETVKQFAALGKDPLQASIKLNETTRFLTTSVYQNIKALQEQGRTVEAAAAAQKAYADALESRGAQIEARLGSIERGWRAIKDATKEALDAILSVGRADTLQERLAKEQANLDKLRNGSVRVGRDGAERSASAAEIRAAEATVETLKETIRLENRSAEAKAAAVRQTQARIEADKEGLKYKEKELDVQTRMNAEITKQVATLRAAGAGGDEIASRVKAIVASFQEKEKKPKSTAAAERAIDRSELAFDLSKIKADSDRLLGIYTDAERILETLRAGGLVNERDYYESRRQFIALESQAKERAFEQEIARLQQEDLKGKDKIDNTRKIAEAEAQLAILRAKTSSELTNLNLQQKISLDELAKSYDSARQAAQDYLDTQNRQQDRLIQGLGQGERQRGFDIGRNQIEDNFTGQRRELENLRVLGKLSEGEYEKRLAIIEEFQQRSLQSFADYYDQLIKMQSSAAIGASEAINNYVESAENIAQTTDDLFSRTFQNAEDALTEFLTTGKLNYKAFADSLVADITRIIVKQQLAIQVQKLMGLVGPDTSSGSFLQSLLGGALGFGGKMSSGAFGIGISGAAMGGTVSRGQIIEVNETKKGPGELLNVGSRQYLLASQAGSITPQKQEAKAAQQAITVINNFTLPGRVDRATEGQIAKAVGRGMQTSMTRNS
jgi:lambda family phage tail tape measure protein